MIQKFVISNFRSIGPDTCIAPGRLSVFVGPNGAGKSNVLSALSFLRDAVLLGLPAAVIHRGGIDAIRRRSKGRPFDVHLELTVYHEDTKGTYAFVITGDKAEAYAVKSESAHISSPNGRVQFTRKAEKISGLEGLAPRTDSQSLVMTSLGGDERFKPFVDYLSKIAVYSIFPDTLRLPQKFDLERPMRPHGENWVSILREIDLDRKRDLVAALTKLTGDISDIRVASAAQYLVAEFRQETSRSNEKKWYEADRQSDGTLRVAGLITALLQQPPLSVVGIEEPELTVHPGAIPLLYDYLNQASEMSQVLFTTHSPLILDVVDIDKVSLFSVDRLRGVTRVGAISDVQLEPVRKRLLRLGDLLVSRDLQLSLFDDEPEP